MMQNRWTILDIMVQFLKIKNKNLQPKIIEKKKS